MERWPVVESAAEYDTGWYAGGYDLVEQPDGSTKRYYWADLPPAVVVVPVLDGEVVFVEQYRPAIREHCLELPAGIVEVADDADPSTADADPSSTVDAGGGAGATADGEAVDAPGDVDGYDPGDVDGYDPEAGRESYVTAGRRELREETGYAAGEAALLESFWCSTGVLRHRRGIVVADDLEAVGRDLDGNEFLSVRTVPAGEALATARAAPANDATIEGLLLARADGYL